MNFSLEIPDDLATIIKEEEVWEEEIWVDDQHQPIFITIDEYRFQLHFPSWDDIGATTDYVKAIHLDWSGYDWTNWLFAYIEHKNPNLTKQVEDDSEADTCVLLTSDAKSFQELLLLTIEFMKLPPVLKEGIDLAKKQ